jgi:phytanoyl-CoA hydroxylase
MSEVHPPQLYSGTRRARCLANLQAVNDGDLERFREDGYLAVERAFDAERVAAALEAIDSLIAGSDPDFRGVSYEKGHGSRHDLPADERPLHVRKLMNFVDADPRLGGMSTDATLLALVARLMDGAEPELFQDMALLKPPGGREKPWHQDMAYFNVPVHTTVVGVWIALDEATADNGALHVLPGSHRAGPREHFRRRDWQICDTEIPLGDDVVVELPPGGALLWHGLMHHGSPDNHSQRRRRALQFHYRPAGVELTTTEERMQHYGGEVRGAEC